MKAESAETDRRASRITTDEMTLALSFEEMYEALRRRDRSYEGRVYVCVRSTGVFCRVGVCPAPLPRPENVAFVQTVARALRLGFRPCRRCRPEVEGGLSALERRLVREALALLTGDAGPQTWQQIAERLGVSPSHLHRLFVQHTGRRPSDYRTDRRVDRAKALLAAPGARIVDVAFEAGFGSVSQFNRTFRQRMGMSPREYRRSVPSEAARVPAYTAAGR